VISVDTRGRMGNQMFQLAFAHAASRRLGTSFVLGPGVLWDGFALGAWGRRHVRLRRKLEFRVRYGADPADKVEVDENEDPAAVVERLRDGVAYGGYFQSEQYFAGYEHEVRELFRVHQRHRDAYDAKYSGLRPFVCVHMRRGDYFEWGPGGRALPTSYFLDALASVEDVESHEVIVISDDLEHAAAELASVPGVRFESNPAMVDLLLLMNASVVVTSNSSFSWWGAWLNANPGVRVLVPEHWAGFPEHRDRPAGIIASGWKTIPVDPVPMARPPQDRSPDAAE
jgi:hypothetical protein